MAGLVGQSAINVITLQNTITEGTHFFDGIDMFPRPPGPSPPVPVISAAGTPAEIFASYLTAQQWLAYMVGGGDVQIIVSGFEQPVMVVTTPAVNRVNGGGGCATFETNFSICSAKPVVI